MNDQVKQNVWLVFFIVVETIIMLLYGIDIIEIFWNIRTGLNFLYPFDNEMTEKHKIVLIFLFSINYKLSFLILNFLFYLLCRNQFLKCVFLLLIKDKTLNHCQWAMQWHCYRYDLFLKIPISQHLRSIWQQFCR